MQIRDARGHLVCSVDPMMPEGDQHRLAEAIALLPQLVDATLAQESIPLALAGDSLEARVMDAEAQHQRCMESLEQIEGPPPRGGSSRHSKEGSVRTTLPPFPWAVSEGPLLLQIRDATGELLLSINPRLHPAAAGQLARAITALPLLVQAQVIHDQVPGLDGLELEEACTRASDLEAEAMHLITREKPTPPPLHPAVRERVVTMVGREGPAFKGSGLWSHRIVRGGAA